MSTKFLKSVVTFGFACVISFPVSAAKPPSTQYLLAGPFPINLSSGTEILTCNVINQTYMNPIDTIIQLCGMVDGTGANCTTTGLLKVTGGKSAQLNTSDTNNANDVMVYCEVRYEGKQGDLTGTTCLFDPTIGSQTCLPLQEGSYLNLKNIR